MKASWWERLTEGETGSCSDQFSSVTQSCPALCDPMDCSTPGLPVHHQLPEITQTHVHRVGDAIQPSHPLSSPSLPAFSLSQHQGLCSSESVLCIKWPKYWSFSFSISPSNEYSGLISFRMDWLHLLAVQGPFKSLLQYHSSKASILRHSAFFTVQLSHPYMTTGKTIALTRQTFVGKVMSLLLNMLSVAKLLQSCPTLCDPIDSSPLGSSLSLGFSRQEHWSGLPFPSPNMLSRLDITLLPRSKRLLISWLQSPSAVILVPKK